MNNPQEEFWRGDFGNEYGRRNRVDWRKRIPFWTSILAEAKPHSILEVGANAGWNMRAIREVNPEIYLYGIDVNHVAVTEALFANLNVFEMSAANLAFHEAFDLTMTVGMLIHVSPADLRSTMRGIVDASRKFVLAIEYGSDKEEEVNYRGHAERLWRRPFGKLYEDIGLQMVVQGKAPADAFDSCHFWLMRKP